MKKIAIMLVAVMACMMFAGCELTEAMIRKVVEFNPYSATPAPGDIVDLRCAGKEDNR